LGYLPVIPYPWSLFFQRPMTCPDAVTMASTSTLFGHTVWVRQHHVPLPAPHGDVAGLLIFLAGTALWIRGGDCGLPLLPTAPFTPRTPHAAAAAAIIGKAKRCKRLRGAELHKYHINVVYCVINVTDVRLDRVFLVFLLGRSLSGISPCSVTTLLTSRAVLVRKLHGPYHN
jgi:hypothetical protein